MKVFANHTIIHTIILNSIILNPRFWWRIREIWHAPHFHTLSVNALWPRLFTLADIHEEGLSKWAILKERSNYYRTYPKTFKRDLKQAGRSILWHTLAWQPLCCKGNAGGWQTSFCNYLENQAREAEEIWYECKRQAEGYWI